MQKLSPRDQHILVLYYDRDTKMKEIGQILGINESRVSQLRKRAVLQMTMELQSLGITSRRAI
jgi:RNA polymerase sigma factor for flagellar operon FliA